MISDDLEDGQAGFLASEPNGGLLLISITRIRTQSALDTGSSGT